jgi:hypothetical protein
MDTLSLFAVTFGAGVLVDFGAPGLLGTGRSLCGGSVGDEPEGAENQEAGLSKAGSS